MPQSIWLEQFVPSAVASDRVVVLVLRPTPETVPDFALELLEDEERSTACSFADTQARLEYVAAHALKRVALATCLGVSPRALRFTPSAGGKPRLIQLATVELDFSISHARGMVGCAIARGERLGIDIEPWSRVIPLPVAQRFIDCDGLRAARNWPRAQRARRTLRLWTQHEAREKASGRGLTLQRTTGPASTLVRSFDLDSHTLAVAWCSKLRDVLVCEDNVSLSKLRPDR